MYMLLFSQSYAESEGEKKKYSGDILTKQAGMSR